MTDDSSLLRRFAADRSEEAFAEVVRRNLNLVYSAALRKTGDAQLAEDVSQKVFALLARKAGTLGRHPALVGWLYTTTHYTAAKTMRTEWRRRTREQEAQAMQDLISAPAPTADWERLRPVLDDAMQKLNQRDREAVLLRYFENRAFAEVGARQGVSENAARMRVDRALEKLHALLARRGVTSTTAALTLLLADHAVVAAPAGLATAVSGAAVAGAAGSGGTFAFWSLMSAPKLFAGLAGVAVMAVGIGVVLQQQVTADMRAEIGTLEQQAQVVTRLRDDNQRLAKLQVPADEVARLRADSAELAQVRAEVAGLRAQLAAAALPASTQPTASLRNGLPVYNLTKVEERPRVTVQGAPIYPLPMLFDGSTGEVVIGFTVDANGDVVDATVVKSSDPAFDDSALAAVSRWKFAPGKKGGQPVNTRLQVPIIFSLRDPGSAKR